MIIIEPKYLLANKMRSLNSAISLSKKINKPLVVIWDSFYEANCPLEKLFDFPRTIKVVNCNNKLNFKDDLLVKHYYKSRSDIEIGDLEIKKLLHDEYNFEDLSRYKSVYIWTSHSFYKYTDFDSFQPIKKLKKIIDDYRKKFNSETIGVHIRRSDNSRSIEVSKTEFFIERMKLEAEDNIKTNFFLATDSLNEEIRLKAIFGNKILSRPRELRRDSVQGIQDALVDLMCLANTKKILGSYWSSFDAVAAQIHGIERVEVGMSNI